MVINWFILACVYGIFTSSIAFYFVTREPPEGHPPMPVIDKFVWTACAPILFPVAIFVAAWAICSYRGKKPRE